MLNYYLLEAELDQKAGIKPRSTQEIAESIVKKGYESSGYKKLLKEIDPGRFKKYSLKNIQEGLDRSANIVEVKDLKRKLNDYDLLIESMPEDYTVDARCQQCGWSGTIKVKRGIFVGSTRCPECDCGPGVLLRESNSVSSLGVELDARADVESGDHHDMRESFTIDLSESAYEDNTVTFTLAEGDPGDLVGKKIYMNRQTKLERKERPERSLKSWAATITEAIQKAGKTIVKAFIHDEKLKELLSNPVSRKAMGIATDSGSLCFVTEGGQGLS